MQTIPQRVLSLVAASLLVMTACPGQTKSDVENKRWEITKGEYRHVREKAREDLRKTMGLPEGAVTESNAIGILEIWAVKTFDANAPEDYTNLNKAIKAVTDYSKSLEGTFGGLQSTLDKTKGVDLKAAEKMQEAAFKDLMTASVLVNAISGALKNYVVPSMKKYEDRLLREHNQMEPGDDKEQLFAELEQYSEIIKESQKQSERLGRNDKLLADALSRMVGMMKATARARILKEAGREMNKALELLNKRLEKILKLVALEP